MNPATQHIDNNVIRCCLFATMLIDTHINKCIANLIFKSTTVHTFRYMKLVNKF